MYALQRIRTSSSTYVGAGKSLMAPANGPVRRAAARDAQIQSLHLESLPGPIFAGISFFQVSQHPAQLPDIQRTSHIGWLCSCKQPCGPPPWMRTTPLANSTTAEFTCQASTTRPLCMYANSTAGEHRTCGVRIVRPPCRCAHADQYPPVGERHRCGLRRPIRNPLMSSRQKFPYLVNNTMAVLTSSPTLWTK